MHDTRARLGHGPGMHYYIHAYAWASWGPGALRCSREFWTTCYMGWSSNFIDRAAIFCVFLYKYLFSGCDIMSNAHSFTQRRRFALQCFLVSTSSGEPKYILVTKISTVRLCRMTKQQKVYPCGNNFSCKIYMLKH